MILGEEQKPSLAELQHFGVKGMRWGVRNSDSGGGGGSATAKKPKPKKPTSQEIKEARYRQELRFQKYQEAQGDFITARAPKDQDRAEKKMREREKDFFDNDDAKVADRMTTGEKFALGLNLAGIAAGAILLGAAGRR